MKKGVRLAAIASGPIQNRKNALLVGVIGRDNTIEGVLSGTVRVDGEDSADRISRMIKGSRFREQVRIVALNGIAIAGLNVVDIPDLEKALKVNVIVLTRGKPRPAKLIRALNEYPRLTKTNVKNRIALIKAQAKVNHVANEGFHLESSMERGELRKFAKVAYEMLRIAHLVARGVDSGESKGRI